MSDDSSLTGRSTRPLEDTALKHCSEHEVAANNKPGQADIAVGEADGDGDMGSRAKLDFQ